MKEEICRILKENEYILGAKTVGEGTAKELLIELSDNRRDIHLSMVSKPGQRIYVKSQSIKKVLNGLGISVLSTPKGVMSGSDARKANLGGELLCEIY
jgi:small subunit ribosomal protein S8